MRKSFIAAALLLVSAAAAHAAEGMECCKGKECCCKKEGEGGASKEMDRSKMDHGKKGPSKPEPKTD